VQDPYTVLGLPGNAGEAEIRSRYLELVRQFPPEREPKQAAVIRAAYDAIRDPLVRLNHQLFDVKSPQTLDSIAAEQSPSIRNRRFSTQDLLALGRR
jgi:curved DNA-binding protein CbpA